MTVHFTTNGDYHYNKLQLSMSLSGMIYVDSSVQRQLTYSLPVEALTSHCFGAVRCLRHSEACGQQEDWPETNTAVNYSPVPCDAAEVTC